MIAIVVMLTLLTALFFVVGLIPVYFLVSGFIIRRIMRGYDGTGFWRRVDKGVGASLALAAFLWLIVQTTLRLYDGGEIFDALEQVVREGLPLVVVAHLLCVGLYYREVWRWTERETSG